MRTITGQDAKRRIICNIERLRRDYDKLWGRYVEVVHENAQLCAELDRARREGWRA